MIRAWISAARFVVVLLLFQSAESFVGKFHKPILPTKTNFVVNRHSEFSTIKPIKINSKVNWRSITKSELRKPLSIKVSESATQLSTIEMGNIADKTALVKRVTTAIILAIIGTVWIASDRVPFALGLFLLSVVAQKEYIAMLKSTGLLNDSLSVGVITSFLCSMCAIYYPQYHSFTLPLSASLLMFKLLLFSNKLASIHEMSTTFFGMFYLAYLPSYWILLRFLSPSSSSSSVVGNSIYGNAWPLKVMPNNAAVLWMTLCSIAFSDIGAFFVGKKYGTHKLSSLTVAAGSASPNKSIEGALGGFLTGSVVAMIGAYLLKWPSWGVTGLTYGLVLGVVAMIGDLTASMMKRDANVKDTGSLLPGHGGLLDRIDSYLLTAPIAYLFLKHALPYLSTTRCGK